MFQFIIGLTYMLTIGNGCWNTTKQQGGGYSGSTAGTPNTGGGGAVGVYSNKPNTSGGSGVVVIRNYRE